MSWNFFSPSLFCYLILGNSHVAHFVIAGTGDPLGKKLNNMKTREEVGWEPKYPSFADFLGVSD